MSTVSERSISPTPEAGISALYCTAMSNDGLYRLSERGADTDAILPETAAIGESDAFDDAKNEAKYSPAGGRSHPAHRFAPNLRDGCTVAWIRK